MHFWWSTSSWFKILEEEEIRLQLLKLQFQEELIAFAENFDPKKHLPILKATKKDPNGWI